MQRRTIVDARAGEAATTIIGDVVARVRNGLVSIVRGARCQNVPLQAGRTHEVRDGAAGRRDDLGLVARKRAVRDRERCGGRNRGINVQCTEDSATQAGGAFTAKGLVVEKRAVGNAERASIVSDGTAGALEAVTRTALVVRKRAVGDGHVCRVIKFNSATASGLVAR